VRSRSVQFGKVNGSIGFLDAFHALDQGSKNITCTDTKSAACACPMIAL